MKTESPSIFEQMAALVETTRTRLLLVLEEHEFSVSELCTILQMPQSTVSRHLKVLADEGWLNVRAEGTSRRYRLLVSRLDPTARRLWGLVRGEGETSPFGQQDRLRVATVLEQRRTTSKEFFQSAAGQWDCLRSELFGDRADFHALLGLLSDDWTVADLGCGTGRVTEALAPFVGRVIAVDDSAAMLSAARKRLRGAGNVEFHRSKLEALPLDDESLDAATLILVLHYIIDPTNVFGEIARVLKPGGRLLVVDMMPHDRVEYEQQMGHVWPGFDEQDLGRWMRDHDLETCRYCPLPADPAASGPGLFAAVARRSAAAGTRRGRLSLSRA